MELPFEMRLQLGLRFSLNVDITPVGRAATDMCRSNLTKSLVQKIGFISPAVLSRQLLKILSQK
jgi:hypothetical protein